MTEKTTPELLTRVQLAERRKQAAIRMLDGEHIAEPDVLADMLQQATEQLNPLIERAEKALAALKLNVPAFIMLAYDDEENWGQYLEFRKEGRDWGLFVDSGHDAVDQAEWEHVRLQSASRETRLKALSRLPELEKALIAAANKQCTDALKVLVESSAYLTSLEARKP